MQIILETNEYMVINKPSGMSVHGDGKSDQYTVVDWVLEKYPNISGVGEDAEYNGRAVKRPGIVHRLDKDTTGCLLIAKNMETFEHLKKQFQEHLVTKTYHCFTYGSIKSDSGSINTPIGRSRGDVRMWNTGNSARGTTRDARTDYTVLQRIGVEEEKGSTDPGTYSFVECRPHTGRTHQIRVHLKSINHPIVHDTLYASKRIENDPQANLGFIRQALHAYSLSFYDQLGNVVDVIAPYPEDFEHALNLTPTLS